MSKWNPKQKSGSYPDGVKGKRSGFHVNQRLEQGASEMAIAYSKWKRFVAEILLPSRERLSKGLLRIYCSSQY